MNVPPVATYAAAKPALQPIQVTRDKNDQYPEIKDTESPTEESGQATPLGHPISTAFDEIIPHPDDVHHRNLVLCFDGTGDQFDGDVRFLPPLLLCLVLFSSFLLATHTRTPC